VSHVALTEHQFRTLARLLHEAAGLSFDDSRRDSLGFSVAERMAATGTSSCWRRRTAAPSARRCSTR
jgi:hypothetical protein